MTARSPRKFHLWIPGFLIALGVFGAALYGRRQEGALGRAFALQAAQVRADSRDAVEFYRLLGLRGQVPTAEEVRAWRDRLRRTDAEAGQAARRLPRARPREAARRWLAAHQALRAARLALRAVAVSRILFDYCSERQQFVAQAVEEFPRAVRAAALSVCFDQSGGDAAAVLARLRAEAARLEAAETEAWDELVRAIPAVGR